LESRVFGWCNSLESVVIGRGVTEIPDFCFNHCISLTDVEIPENITKIGVRAFSYCDKLEKVVIPKTVSSVGDLAFVFSPALKFVVIENDDIELGKNILSDSPEAAIVSKVDSKSYYYCVEQKLLWTESIEATPTRLGNE